MKKYGKLSIAGMLIATIAASSAISPAYAGKKERRIAAGIAIGAIASISASVFMIGMMNRCLTTATINRA